MSNEITLIQMQTKKKETNLITNNILCLRKSKDYSFGKTVLCVLRYPLHFLRT